MHAIWKIEKRFHGGVPLTQTELQVAMDTIDTEDYKISIVACEVVLGSALSDTEKERAATRLEMLAKQVLGSYEEMADYLPGLLVATYRIPASEWKDSNVLHNLAHFAVVAPDRDARLNSMLLLERLSQNGDSKSLKAIENAVDDEDEFVRGNAMRCLSRLKP